MKKLSFSKKSVLYLIGNIPKSKQMLFLNIQKEIKNYVSSFDSIDELMEYLKESFDLDSKNKGYCLEVYTNETEYVFCINLPI